MDCWIDTHCHLDAPEFAADAPAVRARAAAAGVVHCVIPAVAVAHFDAVRALAHGHGDSYALGIHPLCVAQSREQDLQALDRALGAHRDDPRLVAVGEIGLDFFVPALCQSPRSSSFDSQINGYYLELLFTNCFDDVRLIG